MSHPPPAVRCADCRHAVTPARTWRGEVFDGWCNCRLLLAEPLGRATFRGLEVQRDCASFGARKAAA